MKKIIKKLAIILMMAFPSVAFLEANENILSILETLKNNYFFIKSHSIFSQVKKCTFAKKKNDLF